MEDSVPGDYGQSEVIIEKKPPRKPRPSEIAAKLAKEKAKLKPTVKKAKVVKKKAAKPKTKKVVKKKAAKSKKPVSIAARSERLDLRVTKAEKAAIRAKAKKLKRTVTSLAVWAIDKIR
jgi:hypothetical protein